MIYKAPKSIKNQVNLVVDLISTKISFGTCCIIEVSRVMF